MIISSYCSTVFSWWLSFARSGSYLMFCVLLCSLFFGAEFFLGLRFSEGGLWTALEMTDGVARDDRLLFALGGYLLEIATLRSQ
jgi:hypothetical protein